MCGSINQSQDIKPGMSPAIDIGNPSSAKRRGERASGKGTTQFTNMM